MDREKRVIRLKQAVKEIDKIVSEMDNVVPKVKKAKEKLAEVANEIDSIVSGIGKEGDFWEYDEKSKTWTLKEDKDGVMEKFKDFSSVSKMCGLNR